MEPAGGGVNREEEEGGGGAYGTQNDDCDDDVVVDEEEDDDDLVCRVHAVLRTQGDVERDFERDVSIWSIYDDADQPSPKLRPVLIRAKESCKQKEAQNGNPGVTKADIKADIKASLRYCSAQSVLSGNVAILDAIEWLDRYEHSTSVDSWETALAHVEIWMRRSSRPLCNCTPMRLHCAKHSPHCCFLGSIGNPRDTAEQSYDKMKGKDAARLAKYLLDDKVPISCAS